MERELRSHMYELRDRLVLNEEGKGSGSGIVSPEILSRLSYQFWNLTFGTHSRLQ